MISATGGGTFGGMLPVAHRRTNSSRATGGPSVGTGTPQAEVTSQFTSRMDAWAAS
jgi:hypothetical protein